MPLSDSFCGTQAYPNAPHYRSEPSTVAGLFGGSLTLFSNIFVGFTPSPVAQSQPSSSLNVDFESVFGNKTSNVPVDSSGFDELGGLLKPTVASQNQSLPSSRAPPNKLVLDDLDSSLANLVGNLGIGNGTTKNDVNWTQPGEKKLTGGSNWQPKVAPTTAWNAPTVNGMHFPQYAPPVMAYPATTPTGMMGYGMVSTCLYSLNSPSQMAGVPVMTQPTLIYSQPVMRPPNPFGPVSGAQLPAASSPSTQSPHRASGKDPFAELSLQDFL
ncbi:hypothetical protein lerEdw1_005866 [Lerista edwardsae]|nr:hypothetical protein lerEdw1_005866 [Lerista edwardsae]